VRAAAFLVSLADKAHLASLAALAVPVSRVLPDFPVARRQFATSRPSHHAASAHLVLLATPVLLVNQVTLARPVSLAVPETMDLPDHLAHRDHLDPLVNPVVMVLVVSPADLLFPHPHCLVIPDRTVIRDHLACLESLDNLAVTVNPDHLAPRDRPDLPAHLVNLADPEIPDPKARPVCKVNVVSVRNIVPSTAVFSLKTAPEESKLVTTFSDSHDLLRSVVNVFVIAVTIARTDNIA